MKKSQNQSSCSFASPAKINLFFRVLFKREDGYHEIASLYQAIDLSDRLYFAWENRDLITCSDPLIPLDHSNLIYKALLEFRRHFSTPPIHIHLEKNIPTQAGLGGGSSNAATTLWALNSMLQNCTTTKHLMEMGAKIGSDVPFFFSSGTAYCTGRGEILQPHTLTKSLQGFIAKPSFGISTPQVYQNIDLQALSPIDPKKALEQMIYVNDLERAAFKCSPQLRTIKQQLLQHFSQVTMTGSGSAFVCFKGAFFPIDEITYFPFQSVQRTSNLSWYCS